MYIASGQSKLRVLQLQRPGLGCSCQGRGRLWQRRVLQSYGSGCWRREGGMQGMATAAADGALYLCCGHMPLLPLQWQEQPCFDNVAVGP